MRMSNNINTSTENNKNIPVDYSGAENEVSFLNNGKKRLLDEDIESDGNECKFFN